MKNNEIDKTKKKQPINPDQVLYQANLFIKQGKLDDSLKLIKELINSIKDNDTKVLYLSRSAFLVKDFNIDQAQKFSLEATKHKNSSAFSWYILSIIEFKKRNKPDALKAALNSLEKNPSPQELVDIGRHLSDLGEDKVAINSVRLGYIQSKESIKLASYSLRVALKYADWSLSNSIIKKLIQYYKLHVNIDAIETPRTHLLWCGNEDLNIKVISKFAENVYPAQQEIQTNIKKQKNKIRIGFLSSDFRNHPTSFLFMGLLRFYDKNNFELYAYCTSYDDGSALRRDILSRFTVAKTLEKIDDISAAKMIATDQIDILIDLNGLTEGSRLGIFAYRPSSIQISYLGFPGTAGGRFIDYIIADDYTIPKKNEHLYPEKIIRIPPTYQINDYSARFLPPAPKKSIFKMPKDRILIGMFNNINKVGPIVWGAWLSILNLAPNSILWILDPGEIARNNILNFSSNLKDYKERIFFAPKLNQDDHLARFQLCDLAFDPWPYGGHTTTGDALFCGVPVVCLEGQNFASRVSGGLVKAANLEELIFPDIDKYISGVASLINDQQKLILLKKRLITNRANLPAFNAQLRTLQLEAAFKYCIDRQSKGLPKQNIRVNVGKNEI